MSYSKLNLNRSLIEETLEETGAEVSGPELKGTETHYHIAFENEPVALLVFYFNKDGTTTISPRGGNAERSKELADLLVAKCLYSEKSRVELYIKMTRDDFDAALEYLIDECDAEKLSEQVISGGVQFKVAGACGNQLTIKHFEKRQAAQVQGKPLSLYDNLIEILCELLPYEETVKAQLEQVQVEVKPEVVRSELEARLPNAFSFLTDKVVAIISPALVLNKLDVEMDDYTAIAMPALRGMEAYLKLLFSNKNMAVDKSFGDFIESKDDKKVVKDGARDQLGCVKTVTAIEKCYTFWVDNRHSLFHVDANVETTRTLDQLGAGKLIQETLELIDTTYAGITN